MIKTRGVNGKLNLEFSGLDVFGTPENTRVIYMKLKESGPQYELLQDIVNLIVHSFMDNQMLEKHELTHIRYDYKKQYYSVDQFHLSLVNASWAPN